MKTKLYCYICGKELKDKFSLVTMSLETDRVFVMHEKCSVKVEKDYTAIIPVLLQ